MFEFFNNLDKKTMIIIGVMIACVVIISCYFLYEGFDNSACLNLRRNHKIVVNTMNSLPKETGDTRDNINNAINYHDMQSRDIVLGDEKTSWCARLPEKEQKAVLDEIGKTLDTEVELFDGLLIDQQEKQSNDNGIMYNGTDAYDTDYAPV